MNFNLQQKMSITALLLAMTVIAHAEGQFEKLVHKKLPKHLSDCQAVTLEFQDEAGNSTTVGSAFELCVKNLSQQFKDFADLTNNEHARVHAQKMRAILDMFRTRVIDPINAHFNRLNSAGSLDAKNQAAFAALIKILSKMHADLNDIANLLANYNGSLALLDLRSLGNNIMQDKWSYLLPGFYSKIPPVSFDSTPSWKSIFEKRYGPTATK